MTSQAQTPTQTKEPVFTISRVFDAPRDLVWETWTDPKHLAHWWGPKGSTVARCDMNLAPGGIFHYALKTADGSILWGKWVFREIVKPERMTAVTSFSDEKGGETRHPMAPTWPLKILSTMTFEDVDGKTKVTVHWSPLAPSDIERDTFTAGMDSMKQGWGGTIDKYAAYLETIR
jgi:uncharacterized protein YndB with AHSA1/START domain